MEKNNSRFQIKKYGLLILAGSLFLLSSCASFYYTLAVERKTESSVDNHEMTFKEDSIYIIDSDWFSLQPYVTLQMESGDGLKLTGYWLPNRSADGTVSKNTVILVHGYSADAFTMSSFARFYYEQLGFNVFAADARGHGASEGEYIGFGWHERFDIIDWTKEVTKITGEDCSMLLHGISMGGATVMMCSGEELPPYILCIIEDCGYTSVHDQLAYLMENYRGGEDSLLLQQISDYTESKAGYNFEEASALAQVEKAEVPIFFIHGSSDTYVPTEMVYRLYDACPSPKKLFLADGAGHGHSWDEANDEYRQKVIEFLVSCGFDF